MSSKPSCEISGPQSVPCSRGSSTCTLAYARSSRSIRVSATDSCTISRRSEVQRWPQVPTAANRIARTARSRSALGVTIIALLPPSSSSERPRRAATFGAIARPIAVDPVADTSGTRGSSTSARPALPTITSTSPSGALPKRSTARRNSA